LLSSVEFFRISRKALAAALGHLLGRLLNKLKPGTQKRETDFAEHAVLIDKLDQEADFLLATI
jgi:hypothetical protein